MKRIIYFALVLTLIFSFSAPGVHATGISPESGAHATGVCPDSGVLTSDIRPELRTHAAGVSPESGALTAGIIPQAGGGEIYYVSASGNNSGDGTIGDPWKTIQYGVGRLHPGDTLRIRGGVYRERITMTNISGSEDAPIHIVSAPGETAILDGGGSGSVLEITDCADITIEGLDIRNGARGINYESTTASSTSAIENVSFVNNTIHDINGTHAIGVYGGNDLAPMKNFRMTGNTVYFTRTDSSEATVLNGNIDGFTVSGNVIYNGNNIGIDLIGFEGTARFKPGGTGAWDYSVDYVRNGEVHDNVVFGSNTNDNTAYWGTDSSLPFGGYYGRSCDGIYVDGGSDIEIYNNFIFDNDIGIEIATEHKESQGFFVEKMNVHDNIIASNGGWVGIAFGGYGSTLGYTSGSAFTDNILYGNAVGFGVQKSKDNTIEGNIIQGGERAFELMQYSHLNEKNLFNDNIWYNADGEEDYYEYLDTLPAAQHARQIKATGSLLENPKSGNFTPSGAAVGFGTLWNPGATYLNLYAGFACACDEVKAARTFLEEEAFRFAEAGEAGNLKTYLNAQLSAEGFENTEVRGVLKTGAGANAGRADSTAIVNLTDSNPIASANGNINADRLEAARAALAEGSSKDYAYLVQVITWYGGAEGHMAYTQETTIDPGVVLTLEASDGGGGGSGGGDGSGGDGSGGDGSGGDGSGGDGSGGDGSGGDGSGGDGNGGDGNGGDGNGGGGSGGDGSGNNNSGKTGDKSPAPISLSKATVSVPAKRSFTGKTIKPALTVALSGKTLKNGTEYIATYSNNV
ncbi:MAG: right-handed parallel beta-helix repeat-containing protein, partial [Clostridiales Family XIII bacterium]|nr:right-handed parallel beta-helix repeat-containing protein [Clostridiales Family XIII bacterium]